MSDFGYPIVVSDVFPSGFVNELQQELEHTDRELRYFVMHEGSILTTAVPDAGAEVVSFNVRLALSSAAKNSIHELVEAGLHSRIGAELGLGPVRFLDARATEWPIKAVAGWHTDSVPGSAVASLLIISLTEHWRAGDGGVTEFRSMASAGIRQAFAPRFNRGLALAVSPAAEHRVTLVRRCEGPPRRTLTVALTRSEGR